MPLSGESDNFSNSQSSYSRNVRPDANYLEVDALGEIKDFKLAIPADNQLDINQIYES